MAAAKHLRPHTLDEIKHYIRRFADGALFEPSGLGTILIMVALIENALGSLLKKAFVDGSTADALLDARGGPLGSFKARCDVVYCLGLLPSRDKTDLETLSRIRNLVAHSVDDAEPFSRDDVQKLCESLDPNTYLKVQDLDGLIAELESVEPRVKSLPCKQHRLRFFAIAAIVLVTLMEIHDRTQTPAAAAPEKHYF